MGDEKWLKYFRNRETLLTLVVDCQKLVEHGLLPKSQVILYEIETCARTLCYKLHQIRLKKTQRTVNLIIFYGGCQHVMGGTCFTSFFKFYPRLTFYPFTRCASPKGRIYKERRRRKSTNLFLLTTHVPQITVHCTDRHFLPKY